MKLSWIIILSLTVLVSPGIQARFIPEDDLVSENKLERLSDKWLPRLTQKEGPPTTYVPRGNDKNPKTVGGFHYFSIWIKESLCRGVMIKVMEVWPTTAPYVATKGEFTRPAKRAPPSPKPAPGHRPMIRKAPHAAIDHEFSRPVRRTPPCPKPARGKRPMIMTTPHAAFDHELMRPAGQRPPSPKMAPPIRPTPRGSHADSDHELERPARPAPPPPKPASGTRPESIIELPLYEKSSQILKSESK